jgi:hypothetical protein
VEETAILNNFLCREECYRLGKVHSLSVFEDVKVGTLNCIYLQVWIAQILFFGNCQFVNDCIAQMADGMALRHASIFYSSIFGYSSICFVALFLSISISYNWMLCGYLYNTNDMTHPYTNVIFIPTEFFQMPNFLLIAELKSLCKILLILL